MDPELFRNILLSWHASHERPMPWKGVRDPYRVWLSEIILQQTRVEQGRPYYERFVERFPDVFELARASEDEVFKLWEGLGYYRRARHMLETARRVAFEMGGRFPASYQELLQLKGVGPYSAAAISSFAFNLPHAVVDGNVIRVLARLLGREDPPSTALGKKAFRQLAQDLLDPERPGAHNQAIMDFGASVCTPKAPACSTCPFSAYCIAQKSGRIHKLPVKRAQPDRRVRHFHYLVLQFQDEVFIRQRTDEDIWQKLYEFPLLELPFADASLEQLVQADAWQSWGWHTVPELVSVTPPFRQTLSHQYIHARFWAFRLEQLPSAPPDGCFLTKCENLHTFAWPRILRWYLQDNSLYLKLT